MILPPFAVGDVREGLVSGEMTRFNSKNFKQSVVEVTLDLWHHLVFMSLGSSSGVCLPLIYPEPKLVLNPTEINGA